MLSKSFETILWDSYRAFEKHGSRSNKKLIPLHGYIAQELKNTLGELYDVNSLGFGSKKEEKIEGRLNNKLIDISILKEGNFLGGIGVKFVMGNYQQNINNYLENMIGETFNIRESNYCYSQILIIRNPTPYNDKNGKMKKIEYIKGSTINKYKKLCEINLNQNGVPNSLYLLLVDTRGGGIKEFDISKIIDIEKDVEIFYKNNSNLDVFIDKFSHLIKSR